MLHRECFRGGKEELEVAPHCARIVSSLNQLRRRLGQVDGAHDRLCEQLVRQLLRPRLFVQECQNCGCIQHDLTHAVPPLAFPRSVPLTSFFPLRRPSSAAGERRGDAVPSSPPAARYPPVAPRPRPPVQSPEPPGTAPESPACPFHSRAHE